MFVTSAFFKIDFGPQPEYSDFLKLSSAPQISGYDKPIFHIELSAFILLMPLLLP
jgi:hypothetical protein